MEIVGLFDLTSIINITFVPLSESHFSLLLKWLEAPHVKSWWDQSTKWTPELIQQKYGDYVKGYKLENGTKKPINAFIICIGENPIGYIQVYNAYDFSRSKPLNGLPKSLAAFDIFIGEESFLKNGIGTKVMNQFFENNIDYSYIFASPDSKNIAAMRAYEKTGFTKIDEQTDTNEVWMIKRKSTCIIYLVGNPGTGKYTISEELSKHKFIVCDNQLINNPIFTLLNYDGFSKIPEIGWNAIGHIRNAVLDFISIEQNHNYVLTNCLYENEGDRRCYSQVESMALKRGSLFVPVKLLISEEENIKRITEPSRRARWKSIDPQDVYQREQLITIEHPHLLELDVTKLLPGEAAEKILAHIRKLKS